MLFANKKKKFENKTLSEKRVSWRRQKDSFVFPSFGRILFYLLEIVFLGTIVYLLFFSSFLSINNVEVAGAENIETDEVKKYFQDKLAGEYLGFLPKNNILLIFKKSAEENLKLNFKRIAEVKIEKIFPEKIKISIKEKKFKLVFSTNGSEYLIDESGNAWPRKDFELKGEENNFIIFNDESQKPIEDMTRALDKDVIGYVLEARRKIEEEVGIETGSNFSSPRLISGDLKVEIRDGWRVYFNREIDLEKSIETLKLILREKLNTEERKNLEYIDLRINNKVYYKLKPMENKNQPAEDQNSSSKSKSKKKNS
jgi:cell division septal protein FtsQ